MCFISEDPTGFADGPNPYRYAGNDPLKFSDPTGLSQAGNPLNNLLGRSSKSGGISTSSLINTLSVPKDIDFSLYGPLQLPSSRSSVDVNARYLNRYANDASFRNRMDDEYALSRAEYASRNGSAMGASGGKLQLTTDRRINSAYAAAAGLFTEPTFVAADLLDGGRRNYSSTFQIFNADSHASVTQNLINGTRTIRDTVFQTETLSSGYQYFNNPTIENSRTFSDNLFNTSTLLLGGTQTRFRPTINTPNSSLGPSMYQQPSQQQQGFGSYTNRHESGKTYSGKGDQDRMNKSARDVSNQYDDPVVDQDYTPAATDMQSFIDEQNRIDAHGGPGGDTYNKINSPGKKLRDN